MFMSISIACYFNCKHKHIWWLRFNSMWVRRATISNMVHCTRKTMTKSKLETYKNKLCFVIFFLSIVWLKMQCDANQELQVQVWWTTKFRPINYMGIYHTALYIAVAILSNFLLHFVYHKECQRIFTHKSVCTLCFTHNFIFI